MTNQIKTLNLITIEQVRALFKDISNKADESSDKFVVGWDSESNELSPFFASDDFQGDYPQYLGLSFSYNDWDGFYIPLRKPTPEILEDPKNTSLKRTIDLFSIDEEQEIYDLFLDFLNNPKILKVPFNISHEIKWCKVVTGHFPAEGQSFDPMLAFFCAHMGETFPKNLKAITNKVIGGPFMDYEKGLDDYRDKFCRKHSMKNTKKESEFRYDLFPLDIISPYAAIDAIVARRQFFISRDELAKKGLKKTFWERLQLPAELTAMTMEYNGIAIDEEYLDKFEEEVSQELEDLYEKVISYNEVKKAERLIRINAALKKNAQNISILTRRKEELELKKEKCSEEFTKRDQACLDAAIYKIQTKRVCEKDFTDIEFNIGSDNHLLVLVTRILGIKLKKKTAGGDFSIDADVLESINQKHVVIKDILEYKNRSKLFSTYIIGLRKFTFEGRCRGNYNYHIAVSGRLSSSRPNHQNFPRDDKRFNRMIVSSPGHTLLYADLSNIEARLAAVLSKDENLSNIFRVPGGDMHAATAKFAFDLPESVLEVSNIAKADDLCDYAKKRQNCKAVNFLAIFLGTHVALRKKLPHLSEKESKEYIDGFWNSYPSLKEYFEGEKAFILSNKYIQCISGRKRFAEMRHWFDNYERFGQIRSMCNTLIQGPASDILQWMIREIYEQAKSRNLEAVPVRVVHDSIMFEVLDKDLDSVVEILYNVMTKWPDWIKETNGVLLETDVKVGKIFSEMEKYNDKR